MDEQQLASEHALGFRIQRWCFDERDWVTDPGLYREARKALLIAGARQTDICTKHRVVEAHSGEVITINDADLRV